MNRRASSLQTQCTDLEKELDERTKALATYRGQVGGGRRRLRVLSVGLNVTAKVKVYADRKRALKYRYRWRTYRGQVYRRWVEKVTRIIHSVAHHSESLFRSKTGRKHRYHWRTYRGQVYRWWLEKVTRTYCRMARKKSVFRSKNGPKIPRYLTDR